MITVVKPIKVDLATVAIAVRFGFSFVFSRDRDGVLENGFRHIVEVIVLLSRGRL